MQKNITDPSQNYIERYAQPLDALFLPKSVALIGAKDTEGSVGKTILANLMEGEFSGKIYPVNPKRSEVFGLKCYPDVLSIPDEVDLVVIVTPSKTVPGIMKQCVEAKVKGAIVISAGFKELGEPGILLEQEMLKYAKEGNIPVIGPNCLGVMNPIYGLNATFAKGMALKGNIAFISQSGAMLTSVLDWSFSEKIGFSSFVSIGSMADVDWGDLIDYLGGDPNTHSILIYMESIGDPRSFLTAAREIALEKPIIVIKAGRSEAAAEAAASHTGSLAGSDVVFDAALERAGVLRVNSISELFRMASSLARQPRPKGPSLAIITNAGGPAVLATDATVLNGAELAQLDPSSIEKLNAFLPAAWSHANPVDILGDAGPNEYAKTLQVLADDQGIDGVLTVLTPQDVTDPTAIAECLVPYADLGEIPVLASWMGGDSVKEGKQILTNAGIPCFAYPDDAAKTFATMWQYSQNLQLQYETPAVRDYEDDVYDINVDSEQRKQVHEVVDVAIKDGRTLLNEFESKMILNAYGIKTVETHICTRLDEAVHHAETMGYPIVLKLFSKTITHKTDVGGVKLDLQSADEVSRAFEEIKAAVTASAGEEHFQGVTVQRMIKLEGYELILGSTTDPQFGPVLLFGLGGQLVEVFKDTALAIPPLNPTLARRMMEKTVVYEMLKGVRGREPIDLNLLEQNLVRFSQLIVENPRIKECDINPLLVSPEEIIALDSRVVLHDSSIADDELPTLAIRPYPIEYVLKWTTEKGIPITLRPIRPEDEPVIVAFHKELSEESVRQRYFDFMSLDARTSHERLIRICFTDYDREFPIIAELSDTGNGQPKIIGMARLSRIPGTSQARLKLIIADSYHNQGLGTKMLQQMIHIAKEEHIDKIEAHILEENAGMIKICQQQGFQTRQLDGQPIILAEY